MIWFYLQRILHGFDDERSVCILHSCCHAMTPTSRVLIIQQVMPPPGAETASEMLFHGVMSDLNMLAVGGGRERTEAEYRALLEAVGLRLTRVIPTQSLMSVVEGMRTLGVSEKVFDHYLPRKPTPTSTDISTPVPGEE